MSHQTSLPLRTTTQIAELLAGTAPADVMKRMSRRLEHWGNVDLLRPTGEKHTGRGRARRYDGFEQFKGAVLLRLAEYQAPSAILEIVATLFNDIRTQRSGSRPTVAVGRPRSVGDEHLQRISELLAKAEAGDKRVYLHLVGVRAGDRPAVHLTDSACLPDDQVDAVIINLLRAAERLWE